MLNLLASKFIGLTIVTELNLSASTYIPEYFCPQEYVSKAVYAAKGNRVLRYIDTRILITSDQLRRKFGPTTINNWHANGNRQYSGLRMSGDPHFSLWSDHSWGRAIDCLFSEYSAQEIRDYIEAHPEEFPHITFIEEGKNITWLHAGCPNLANFHPTIKYDNSLVFWNIDTGQMREITRPNGRLLNE